jgi:vancomycin resistance protein VanW
MRALERASADGGSSSAGDYRYRVYSRHERFLRVGAHYFRRNESWRTVIDRRAGTAVRDELVRENVALVKYVPTGVAMYDEVTGG